MPLKARGVWGVGAASWGTIGLTKTSQRPSWGKASICRPQGPAIPDKQQILELTELQICRYRHSVRRDCAALGQGPWQETFGFRKLAGLRVKHTAVYKNVVVEAHALVIPCYSGPQARGQFQFVRNV